MPWRDIIIANGFVGLLFGLAALFAVDRYSVDAHRWVQESSADEFARAVRLAVLVYVLYALVMLGAGMAWLAVSIYSRRWRGGPAALAIAPDVEPGAAADPAS